MSQAAITTVALVFSVVFATVIWAGIHALTYVMIRYDRQDSDVQTWIKAAFITVLSILILVWFYHGYTTLQ